MNSCAILVDKKVVPESETLVWAAWFEKADRVVKKTELEDGTIVSTVFLGVNYGFGGRDMWFETMVFSDVRKGKDKDCDRYETWDEAEIGHDEMVKKWTNKLHS